MTSVDLSRQGFGDAVGELSQHWQLDSRQCEQLVRFGCLLADDPNAPTTVRSFTGVLQDHLADSLVVLGLPEVRSARTVVDIGAGAGVPGIALAIALPQAEVSLLESNSKKCAFMRRVVELLGLSNVEVVDARAESWTTGRDSCDLATARALAPLDVVLEYAAPLLSVGGAVVAWRGARNPEMEIEAARAAEVLGLETGPICQVVPFPDAENRNLHVFRKIVPTPSRFPRREGVARKRPLGAI